MWINNEVDLTESLIRAQRDGRLVVFAGAGVSMAAPSNLPSFDSLVRDVVGDALEPVAGEPLDRFLGRAADKGVDVQLRARQIIGNPASLPTQLHRDLLALFNSPERIRLITTNFDRHFTTAAREHSPQGVDCYYSPALPLGRD